MPWRPRPSLISGKRCHRRSGGSTAFASSNSPILPQKRRPLHLLFESHWRLRERRPPSSLLTGSSRAAFRLCFDAGTSKPTTALVRSFRMRRPGLFCSRSLRLPPTIFRRCRFLLFSSIRSLEEEEEDRAAWLENVRALDHALRGPRPPSGLGGLDRLFADRKADKAWTAVRDKVCSLEDAFSRPLFLSDFALILATAADRLGSEAPWRGAAGHWLLELLSDLEVSKAARKLEVTAQDCVPILRQLLEARAVRPPYGGHPRIFIWGLLEARLQRADLLAFRRAQRRYLAWPSTTRSVASAEGCAQT